MIIHKKCLIKRCKSLFIKDWQKTMFFFYNLGAKRVPFFQRKLKIDGIIMHYILKKWRKFKTVLKILCAHIRTLTFSLKLECTGIYVGGFTKKVVVLHRCRKYMNDAQPRNFQGNLQNRWTIVTDHSTCTFIRARCDNRWAKKAEKF